MDFVRELQAGRSEHPRPEQRVEISDVLADEMMDLGSGIDAPPFIE